MGGSESCANANPPAALGAMRAVVVNAGRYSPIVCVCLARGSCGLLLVVGVGVGVRLLVFAWGLLVRACRLSGAGGVRVVLGVALHGAVLGVV